MWPPSCTYTLHSLPGEHVQPCWQRVLLGVPCGRRHARRVHRPKRGRLPVYESAFALPTRPLHPCARANSTETDAGRSCAPRLSACSSGYFSTGTGDNCTGPCSRPPAHFATFGVLTTAGEVRLNTQRARPTRTALPSPAARRATAALRAPTPRPLRAAQRPRHAWVRSCACRAPFRAPFAVLNTRAVCARSAPLQHARSAPAAPAANRARVRHAERTNKPNSPLHNRR